MDKQPTNKPKPRQQLVNQDLQLKINDLCFDKLIEAKKEEEISGNQFRATQMVISLLQDIIKDGLDEAGWTEWELRREMGHLPGEQKLYEQCVTKRRRIEAEIAELQKRII